MSRDHLSWELGAYLDDRLSQRERQAVEAHLGNCAACARRLTEARRLAQNLSPALQQALGQPLPPTDLRRRLHSQLALDNEKRPNRPISFGLILSGLGTAVVIILLAVSALILIRSQLPTPPVTPISGAAEPTTQPTSTLPNPTATFTPPSPTAISPTTAAANNGDNPATPTSIATTPTASVQAASTQTTTTIEPPAEPLAATTAPRPTEPPTGRIAFAFYNPAPQRQTYEIHFIRPDGRDHSLFPLDGVSEPALHPTNPQRLAYRAWGDPTGPRSLLSSDLSGREQNQVGGFWEDAQPDWSPLEDRLLYASQREQDRRWRLYTSRGDGSEEVNLPLAGQSPSFAPDGRRFVYEGCDAGGNRCGLWQATLDDNGATATPLLADPQAKSPDWSPGGQAIVYMSQVDGNWDLYLSQPGRDPQRLTTDPAIDGLPVWSPDGQWLAFLSNRGGDWGIWRYRLADGQADLVFAFDGGIFTPPATRYGERNWWDEQLSWGP